MSTKRAQTTVSAPFKGYLSGSDSGSAAGYFSKCLNVLFDKTGCVVKRPGFTTYDVAPSAFGLVSIDGMFNYIRQGISGDPLTRKMIHCGGNVYAVPNAYYLANSIPVKTGMAIGGLVDHAVLSDKYYCANGEDVLQEYDGAAIGDIATPPASGVTGDFAPAVIEVHRSSLWAAGVPGNPSRLFKSVPMVGNDFDTNMATFDPDSGYALEGAAQIDVNPDDGTGVIELVGDHFGQLIVFKGNSIHRLMGATKADFMLPPEGVIDGIETIRGSIIRANNDIYFASLKGIHKLSTVQQFGDNQESYLSLPVQEYYDNLDKFSMNTRCQAIHWPEISCLLWAFSTVGSDKNDVILVYNYAIEAWSVWSGINVKSFAICKDLGTNRLFIGDHSSRIGKANFGMRNDFGSSFTMEIESAFDFEDRARWKGFRECTVGYNSAGGTVEVRARIDNKEWGDKTTIIPGRGPVLGNFLLGTDFLSSDNNPDVGIVDVNRDGKILTVNIQNTSINERCEIQKIIVQAVPQGYFGPQLSTDINKTIDNLFIEEGIYWGEDTEGTWRFISDEDSNLDVEKKESGIYVEKWEHGE